MPKLSFSWRLIGFVFTGAIFLAAVLAAGYLLTRFRFYPGVPAVPTWPVPAPYQATIENKIFIFHDKRSYGHSMV